MNSITIDQLLEQDKQVDELFIDIEKKEKQIDQWLEQFKSLSTIDDYEKRFSDFRWLCFHGKDRVYFYDKKDFLDFFIARQIPEMMLLKEDVLEEIIRYLEAHTIDESDRSSLFNKAEKLFFTSQAILGKEAEEWVTVEKAVKEYQRIIAMGDDSIEKAKFKSWLSKLVFSEKELAERFYFADPDYFIASFTSLIDFFMGVKSDTVYFLVDAYVHPEKYDDEWQAENTVTINNEDVDGMQESEPSLEISEDEDNSEEEKSSAPEPTVEVQNIEESVSTDVQPDKSLPTQEKPMTETPEPTETPDNDTLFVREPIKKEIKQKKQEEEVKVSIPHEKVRAMIENRFNTDENGEFTNISGVLTLLTNLSEQYGDPEIASLYYFDENEGKFIWKV